MNFLKPLLTLRTANELFPAFIFFVVNLGWGLMAATGAVMIATLIAVASGVFVERRLPVLALVTLVLVLGLGSASLLLSNEVFIKIRPTIGDCLFAGALAAGLFFRPSLLERALGATVKLTTHGWRVVTMSWIVFALSLALLNEVAWRTLDTDSWVAVRTVLAPLTIVGYVLITRLLAPRYWDDRADEPEAVTRRGKG